MNYNDIKRTDYLSYLGWENVLLSTELTQGFIGNFLWKTVKKIYIMLITKVYIYITNIKNCRYSANFWSQNNESMWK